MAIYYNRLVYSCLQYAFICWGKYSKTIKHNLQLKKDRIKKTYNKSGTKTKLKPYYDRLQVLNIDGIYKLGGAKFMPKGKLRKLFVFFGNQLGIFRSLFSIHTYST